MDSLLNNFLVLVLAAGTALASPVELATAEVSATCSMSIGNPKISDICSSIANPNRNLEYFHCSPAKDSGDSLVDHYIFQETYTDKENYDGLKLNVLFKAQGTNHQPVRELKSIELIDSQIDDMSSTDVKFASHRNNLVFNLTIYSTDGDYLVGKVTNTQTKEVTEVTCLDISLEK